MFRHDRACVSLALLAFPLVGAALTACSGDDVLVAPPDASVHASFDATVAPTPASDAGPARDAALEGASPADADASGCARGDAGEPTELACAGLYASWATKTVAPGVVEYDPGLHLWSDGAEKTRWIELPPGQKIDTSNMDEWVFPVGTKVWKEFRLATADGGPPRRIETRLLWKRAADTWVRTTYRWSADGESSATELVSGEVNVGGTGYEVPTQSECNRCHDGRRDGVLGFEAVALSTPAASGITMADLVAKGVLTAPPAAPIVIPGNATESAALGWLHVNCGIACHNSNPQAGASATAFFLRLDVATLGDVTTTPAYKTGWNVVTARFDIPDADATYRLHACDPSTSCAYWRASVRYGQPGIGPAWQMPPIDTHRVDDAGLALLAAWLDEGCDAGAPADAGDAGDAATADAAP